MLTEPIITAFLPTANPAESKNFYMNIIGLKLVSEDDYALEFEGNGVCLRITTVGEFKPHPFTVLGFKVEGIEAQVAAMHKSGVASEQYDSLQQNDSGIWTSPSHAQVAWFKDPDGNLISLTEYAAS